MSAPPDVCSACNMPDGQHSGFCAYARRSSAKAGTVCKNRAPKTWTHYYSLGFSVESDHDHRGELSKADLYYIRTALIRRLMDLSDEGLIEAVGLPVDSEENES